MKPSVFCNGGGAGTGAGRLGGRAPAGITAGSFGTGTTLWIGVSFDITIGKILPCGVDAGMTGLTGGTVVPISEAGVVRAPGESSGAEVASG